MDQTTYDSHPLWDLLDQLKAALRDINATADADALSAADEIRRLATATEAYHDGDFDLTSVAMLANLQASWQQVKSLLDNFTNTGNTPYVVQAATNLEAVRERLAALPRPLAHGPAQGQLTRAFNNYRTELDASRAALASALESTQAAAAAREADLQTVIDGLKVEIVTAQQQLADLEAKITTDETRLAEQLQTTNETFIASQTTRDKDYKTWLGEREKAFNAEVAPHLTGVKTSESDAAAHLAAIAALRTNAEQLTQLVAGDVLGDKYGEYAKRERRFAVVWQWIGALSIIGAIVTILFAFGWITDVSTWQPTVLKFSLSIAAAGLATVSFRTAGQALRRSTAFKRQELELRAIEPFLSGVADSDDARTAFFERAFGRSWDEASGKASEESALDNDALIKLVTSIVQAIPKH